LRGAPEEGVSGVPGTVPHEVPEEGRAGAQEGAPPGIPDPGSPERPDLQGAAGSSPEKT
jgi:hypothetical protein